MVRRLASLLLAFLFLLGWTACGKEEEHLLQFSPLQPGDPIAIMDTDLGEIRLRLFPKQAPLAVESFQRHAQAGDYNGVEFHRVIGQFMIHRPLL